METKNKFSRKSVSQPPSQHISKWVYYKNLSGNPKQIFTKITFTTSQTEHFEMSLLKKFEWKPKTNFHENQFHNLPDSTFRNEFITKIWVETKNKFSRKSLSQPPRQHISKWVYYKNLSGNPKQIFTKITFTTSQTAHFKMSLLQKFK